MDNRAYTGRSSDRAPAYTVYQALRNERSPRRARPAFEIIEPAELGRPGAVQLAAFAARVYPRELPATSRLDLATLRRSEDSFVDELIGGRGRRAAIR